MVFLARCRLAALWVSQTARVLADYCLCMFVIMEVFQKGKDLTWHQISLYSLLPFIFLAPISGALGNALLKRWMLIRSATYSLCLATVLGVYVYAAENPGTWGITLSLVMVGTALFRPVCFALLPAAARDTRLSLSRVNSLME